MMLTLRLMTIIALVALLPATVQAQPADSDAAIAAEVAGMTDKMRAFCANVSKKPQPGKFFDGTAVDPAIMALPAGRHALSHGAHVLLDAEGRYMVKMQTGGSMGGCFREQLAEILRNNRLQLAP